MYNLLINEKESSSFQSASLCRKNTGSHYRPKGCDKTYFACSSRFLRLMELEARNFVYKIQRKVHRSIISVILEF